VKLVDAQKALEEFLHEEFKAICGYAYGNFSGGVTLEDADAHFESGLDHLLMLREKISASIARKFKD
jgi:hypothetical protein